MIKAAVYLRVSTAGQVGETKFGLERQRSDIARYAEANDLTLVAEHRDVLTGKSVTRSGLEQLTQNAHRYEAVIISSIDRLARDVSASYKVLARLIDAGFAVYSADFGLIDLSDDMSLVQFNVRSLVAHLEHSAIAKRTRAAHLAMARSGKPPTGLKAYGYRIQDGLATIVQPQAEVVRQIFTWSAQGKTQWWIQEELNRRGVPISQPNQLKDKSAPALWHRTVVSKIVRNPIYKGEYRWRTYDIPVPAVVSPDLWAKAQKRSVGVKPKRDWPLLGHLRCGVCGRRMHSQLDARKRVSENNTSQMYRCSSGNLPSGTCGAARINRAWLEREAERELRRILADADTLQELLQDARPPDTRLAEQLAEIDAEDERWLEAFRGGAITVSELGGYRKALEAQRRALSEPKATGSYALPDYARASSELTFAELIEAGGFVFIATRESVRVTVE